MQKVTINQTEYAPRGFGLNLQPDSVCPRSGKNHTLGNISLLMINCHGNMLLSSVPLFHIDVSRHLSIPEGIHSSSDEATQAAIGGICSFLLQGNFTSINLI